MKMVSLVMILSLSIFFISKSPLIMSMALVMLSLLTALMAGEIFSKWMMCAIFLIFLGGMMVMFIYVCSLSLNEKMIWKNSLFLSSILVICFFFHWLQTQPSASMIKDLYSNSMAPMVVFFIFYLTSTLLICVKLSQSFKGALTKSW